MDNIKVTLLHYTPKEVLIEAMSMPYKTDNFRNMSTENAMKKIKAICIDKKHSSVLEHINFNFKIKGISRLCLQELVRHRLASYTVESTRYTLPNDDKLYSINTAFLKIKHNQNTTYSEELDELVELFKPYVVFYNDMSLEEKAELINAANMFFNNKRFNLYNNHLSNDKLKYFLPESWRTNLVISINIRSLRNLLQLRLSKQAHFEIRHLANLIYQQIPKEYKILFEDLIEI